MGNKVSIKDRFESFITINNQQNVLPALKDLLSEKIEEDDFKINVSPQVVRKFVDENLETFKITLTEVLICINHLFYIVGGEKILFDNEVQYVNNVLILLIRFLPVLHEQKYSRLASQLLWSKNTFPSDRVGEMKLEPYVMEECLAIKLMNSLFQLMFYLEYSISSKRLPEPRKVNIGGLQLDSRLLWKSTDNFRSENDNAKYYYNSLRTKVLECLLACFSSPILRPLEEKKKSSDPWIHFCISPHNTLFPAALVSMLNFGLSYQENGKIPYTQYLVSDIAGEKLAVLSLQLFCLFADVAINDNALYHKVVDEPEFQQIIEHYIKVKEKRLSVEGYEINNTQTTREILQNSCLTFLFELKLTEYYEFISNNVLRILRNPYDVENTFLIESRKKTILLEEVLLVFWRLIEYNKTYLQRFYYQSQFLQIIVHLIYQIHESFTLAAKSTVFYIAIIILSKLSYDRSFAIQLRRKYINDIGFTRIPIFIGNHIDLIFIVFTNGMVDSYVNGYFCYQNNLLAILHNICPFAKDLSSITTSMLIQLLKAVANPKVLRFDKTNLLILRKVLNMIHKILCFQPETSINLLYELISQKKDLEYLKQLPLRKIFGIRSQKSKQEVKPADNLEVATNERDKKPQEGTISTRKEAPEEEEEEKKVNPNERKEKVEHDIIEKKSSPAKQNTAAGPIQLFDDRWMELFEDNMANDLIFVVSDYLQEELRSTYREKRPTTEEELKACLQEQSILGIVPQPGPIMIEVVNDPENINNNLYLFIWHQIILKSSDMPRFDPDDVKLLSVS